MSKFQITRDEQVSNYSFSSRLASNDHPFLGVVSSRLAEMSVSLTPASLKLYIGAFRGKTPHILVQL